MSLAAPRAGGRGTRRHAALRNLMVRVSVSGGNLSMAHLHHPIFVRLSLLVAVFGSCTALDLFRRVRSHIGRTRLVWLGTAAVAMGVSIWSMHFIAMLGFNP